MKTYVTAIASAVVIAFMLLLTGCVSTPIAPATEPVESVESRFLTAVADITEYEQTGNAASIERAIQSLRSVSRDQPELWRWDVMLYVALGLKASGEMDPASLAEMTALYPDVIRQVPPGGPPLPHPSYVAGEFYWAKSAQPGISEYEELRHEREAVAKWQESVRETPDFAPAHYSLARAHFYRDRKELALFEAQQAVKLDPEDPDMHLMLGFIHYDSIDGGDTCFDRRSIEFAVTSFREVARIVPDLAEAHWLLSNGLRTMGQPELAIFEARRAIELDDSNVARAALVDALLAAGRPAEAVEVLRSRRDSTPAARARLGLALLASQEYEASLAAYREALEMGVTDFASALQGYLAARHLSRDEEGLALLGRFGRLAGSPWERQLLAFHLGAVNSDALFAGAETACQRLEAHFYIGYARLLDGDTQAALSEFDKVLDQNIPTYSEWVLALARTADGQSKSYTGDTR